jgi:hypothetical protein
MSVGPVEVSHPLVQPAPRLPQFVKGQLPREIADIAHLAKLLLSTEADRVTAQRIFFNSGFILIINVKQDLIDKEL